MFHFIEQYIKISEKMNFRKIFGISIRLLPLNISSNEKTIPLTNEDSLYLKMSYMTMFLGCFRFYVTRFLQLMKKFDSSDY